MGGEDRVGRVMKDAGGVLQENFGVVLHAVEVGGGEGGGHERCCSDSFCGREGGGERITKEVWRLGFGCGGVRVPEDRSRRNRASREGAAL